MFSDDFLETISAKMVSKKSSIELSIDSIVLPWIDHVPAGTMAYPAKRSPKNKAVIYGLKTNEVSKTSASQVESKDFRDLNHWTANESSAQTKDTRKTKVSHISFVIIMLIALAAMTIFVRTRRKITAQSRTKE